MSTTTLEVKLQLKTIEVLSATEAPAAPTEVQRKLTTGAKALDKTFSATTLPKVDQPPIARELTLAAATTINLAAALALAMPGGATRTLNMTGFRLKWFLFKAAAANNAAGITIAPGASNPYPIFGAAKSIILGPGRYECGGFDGIESDLPVVAGAVKEIDITPGAAGDVLYLELLFGTTP